MILKSLLWLPGEMGSCETAPKSTTVLPQDLLGILGQEDMGQQNQGAPSQPITAQPIHVIRLHSKQTGNRDDPWSAFEPPEGNHWPRWTQAWTRVVDLDQPQGVSFENVNIGDLVSKQPGFECELSFLSLFSREMKIKEKSTPIKLFVRKHKCVLVLNCCSLWRLSKVLHFLINTIP